MDIVIGYCEKGFKIVKRDNTYIVTHVKFKGFSAPIDIAIITGKIWLLSNKFRWDDFGYRNRVGNELKHMDIPNDVYTNIISMSANICNDTTTI